VPVTVQRVGLTWWLWALLGLLALLLGVLWWLLVRRRRYAEDTEADTGQPGRETEAAADITLRR
jgi:cbb3-type cytochrome oxidase subunit 3